MNTTAVFTPRHLADGRVCCSKAHALCDACTAAQRPTPATRTAQFRATAASEPLLRQASDRHVVPAAPDPYARAIELRRAKQPESREAAMARHAVIREAQHPTADPHYEPYGTAADGYKMALALRHVLKEGDGNGTN